MHKPAFIPSQGFLTLAVLGFCCSAGPALAVPVVQAPFAAQYQLSSPSTSPVPGIPSLYGGLTFAPGDPDTLLMTGYSYNTDQSGSAAIYSIGVTRDANQHITGFLNDATLLSPAPGLPGSGGGAGEGLSFEPGSGVLFYTSPRESSLSMLKPGSSSGPDKQINLLTLAPTPVAAPATALAFVPAGFAGAGKFKLASFTGRLYDVTLAADGNGTFNIASVTDLGMLAGIPPQGSTGIVYVAAGNPQFPQENVLAASCDFDDGVDNDLIAYRTDANGNPIIATQRVVVADLCATGAVVDPVTGDLLFTTAYGFPSLYILSGFTVPPPSVGFSASAYSVAETAANAKITVTRRGRTAGAASVNYATSDGTASTLNYSSVSGTLNWAAGDAAAKTFNVPIKNDGRYNTALTVNLALTPATGAALGAPLAATLTIVNKNPKPTVSLTSVNRTVAESVAAVQLVAALSAPTGLPVRVPFTFSGTATNVKDYSFNRDMANKPITAIIIPPGSSSGSLTVKIVDDVLDEVQETLVATMGTPTNAVAGAVTTNTISINDNDAPPTVSFATASGAVNEGSQGAGQPVSTVRVKLSAASSREVRVPVTLSGGTTDARISITSPLSIPAGATLGYAVMVGDNAVDEANKVLNFSLGTPIGGTATLGPQTSFALTVRDND